MISIKSSPKRIPGLDGMRALAIASVVILHISQRYDWPHPGTHAFAALVGRGGGLWTGDGVGVFFVLSGFLITTLLIREYDRTASVDLKSFYIRRAFRILPPLLVYLVVAFLFCRQEQIAFQPQNFLSALLFYRDYYFTSDLWVTQHTWSLSVEEQFYVLWPIVFLLAFHKGGRRAAAKIAAATILITPLLRTSTKLLHFPALVHHEDMMFHCRMDALMAGCFVALCVGYAPFERLYEKLARYWWVLPLEFYGVSLVLGNLIGINYRKSVGLTIDSMAIAFFLLWVSRNPDHWLGRILNSKIFVVAGVLSYSAYLWQTFFLHKDNPTVLAHAPYCFFYIWIAAAASYLLVEKPSLNLRNWFAQRSSQRAVTVLTATEVRR